jgi:hypothetical protein
MAKQCAPRAVKWLPSKVHRRSMGPAHNSSHNSSHFLNSLYTALDNMTPRLILLLLATCAPWASASPKYAASTSTTCTEENTRPTSDRYVRPTSTDRYVRPTGYAANVDDNNDSRPWVYKTSSTSYARPTGRAAADNYDGDRQDYQRPRSTRRYADAEPTTTECTTTTKRSRYEPTQAVDASTDTRYDTGSSNPSSGDACYSGSSACVSSRAYMACVDGAYEYKQCASGKTCKNGSGFPQKATCVSDVADTQTSGSCYAGTSSCISSTTYIACLYGENQYKTCPTGTTCRNGNGQTSSCVQNTNTGGSCAYGTGSCISSRTYVECSIYGENQYKTCPTATTCKSDGRSVACIQDTASGTCYPGTSSCVSSRGYMQCVNGANAYKTCVTGTECKNGSGQTASCVRTTTTQTTPSPAPPSGSCMEGTSRCVSSTAYMQCTGGTNEYKLCPSGSTCRANGPEDTSCVQNSLNSASVTGAALPNLDLGPLVVEV